MINTRDHPRVCGEHTTKTLSLGHYTGSSPRVRGTPRLAPPCRAGQGIIPACAGNTLIGIITSGVGRDHPRVCGEHPYRHHHQRCRTGSSPRVRGTLPSTPLARNPPGIIPACAGNTSVHIRPGGARRDHPRVCGEHQSITPTMVETQGSSPRVRGTLETTPFQVFFALIIPACAGNTVCAASRC